MPEIKPRWYQRRGSKKIIRSVLAKKNPIAVFPTGSGKTIVLCMVTESFLNDDVTKDVLILSHRSSILTQDRKALENYFPGLTIGLYSAGLKSKTISKITVAGIQSVWKKPHLFENVGLVIVDEAHLINHEATGMYRSFLDELGAPLCGLTATHFRLGHGYIHKGKDTLFDELAYDLSSTDNYNKLVDQGYLSKMFPRKTKFVVDTSNVKIRAGEFAIDELAKAVDREAITDVACNEMVRIGNEENLKQWLVFAIDIEHAEHINNKLIELGINSAVVHSKMKIDKDVILDLFRKGVYRAVVNVDLLTTGLDIPTIDLIGTLRPTQSPALHVQILGRGGRPAYADGYDLTIKKERLKAIKNGPAPYCIVLDFAGNINRLGPINAVKVVEEHNKRTAKGPGKPITKVCPKCETIAYAAARYCDCCAHKFEFQQKITTTAGSDEIIAKKETPSLFDPNEVGTWHEVKDVIYSIHSKAGKVSSLKVCYKTAMKNYTEYVCLDHGGYARHLANEWLRLFVKKNERKPKSLSELYKIRSYLRRPSRILVAYENGWYRVKNYHF